MEVEITYIYIAVYVNVWELKAFESVTDAALGLGGIGIASVALVGVAFTGAGTRTTPAVRVTSYNTN